MKTKLTTWAMLLAAVPLVSALAAAAGTNEIVIASSPRICFDCFLPSCYKRIHNGAHDK